MRQLLRHPIVRAQGGNAFKFAKGALGIGGVCLMMWPAVDEWGIPHYFRRSLRVGSEGWVKEAEGPAKWEVVVSEDQEALTKYWHGKLEGRPHVVIHATRDPRLLLCGVLTHCLEPTGFCGKLVLAYIKAINVFADIITGNTEHHHTTFMLVHLTLDHLKRSLASISKEPSAPRPLVVVKEADVFVDVMSSKDNGDHMKAEVDLLRLLLWDLVQSNSADVLIVGKASHMIGHSKSQAPAAQLWYNADGMDKRWIPVAPHTTRTPAPHDIMYSVGFSPGVAHVVRRALRYNPEGFTLHDVASRLPRSAHKDLETQMDFLTEARVLTPVVGTQLHGTGQPVEYIPGPNVSCLDALPNTWFSINNRPHELPQSSFSLLSLLFNFDGSPFLDSTMPNGTNVKLSLSLGKVFTWATILSPFFLG